MGQLSKKVVIRMSTAEHELISTSAKQQGISIGELVRSAADRNVCKSGGLKDIAYRNEKSTMVLLADNSKKLYLLAAQGNGLSIEAFLRLSAVHAALKQTGMSFKDMQSKVGEPIKRKSPKQTSALLAAQKASGERFAKMRALGKTPKRTAGQTDKVMSYLHEHTGSAITTNEVATAAAVSVHLVRDVFAKLKKDGELVASGHNKWLYKKHVDKTASQ